MDWTTPAKPAEFAETSLIEAIIDGHFPIGSNLPAERELAAQLGVTRPTLREALQRLARDGWLEIRHGKPTRVRDYWQEGNLGVLGALARHSKELPNDFISNLLVVRQLMAPAYTRLAVERKPAEVTALLEGGMSLENEAVVYAEFDWQLHHQLTRHSGNPIFTLILNGFCELYQPMALIYFKSAQARSTSQDFYSRLLAAVRSQNGTEAEAITRQTMQDSLALWRRAVIDQQ
jgi:GntR family negative regulator for fad regulon and positive regulator of fabA